MGAVRSDLEHVLRCSLKSCLFFKTHRELHPPCKRKPSLTTCPKQSPFPLKYYKVESCTLEPFFLWAAALLHKNEKGQRASERCGEAVGFRLRHVYGSLRQLWGALGREVVIDMSPHNCGPGDVSLSLLWVE